MLTSIGGMKEKQASVCIRLGIIAILNISFGISYSDMLTSNGGMKEKQASVCIRLGIIAILNIFIWDFLFLYVNFNWRHERKTSQCVY